VIVLEAPPMHMFLTVRPEWESIENVREAVRLAASAVYGDGGQAAHVLAMVAAELLENAVKYGDPGASGPIRFSLDIDQGESVFVVTNAVAPGQDLTPLLAHVSLIGRGADRATYEAKVKEIADQRQIGGLGILRVAIEGNCSVEADTTEPGQLTIRAKCSS
jgi:anti-sigma regulatory factor (Ser/Thr protein kinase)